MRWHNEPGERCAWTLNFHRGYPAGSPDLQAFVRSLGNEEMWRNVVFATLDQDLWPELDTTLLLFRRRVTRGEDDTIYWQVAVSVDCSLGAVGATADDISAA